MKSVKLRLYFIVMPLGVAVIFFAAQPTTDTAATTASIDLNISFPLRVLFSPNITSASITNSFKPAGQIIDQIMAARIAVVLAAFRVRTESAS